MVWRYTGMVRLVIIFFFTFYLPNVFALECHATDEKIEAHINKANGIEISANEWYIVKCDIENKNIAFEIVSNISNPASEYCMYYSALFNKPVDKNNLKISAGNLYYSYARPHNGICPDYFSGQYFGIGYTHEKQSREEIFFATIDLINMLTGNEDQVDSALSSVSFIEYYFHYEKYREFREDLINNRLVLSYVMKAPEYPYYYYSLSKDRYHSWGLYVLFDNGKFSIVDIAKGVF